MVPLPIAAQQGGSERNVVVQVGVERRRLRARLRAGRRTATEVVPAEILIESAAAAAGAFAAVEQHELSAEALKHDLCGVAVVARLVGPLARLDLPFDVDLRALAQIALGDAAEILVEDHDIVPLG